MQMTIDDHVEGDKAVITVGGEVDVYTAPTLREHLLTVIGDGATRVVVDLSAVSFMDSTGLGVLVGGLKRLRQAGGSLRVVCDAEPVLKIFRVTGLMDVFAVTSRTDDIPDSP